MTRSAAPIRVLRAAVLAAAVTTAGTAGLAGCGIPGEDDAHVINDDDLPFGLAADATTTTQLLSGAYDPDAASTTVVLYFPGEGGALVRVPHELSTPYTLQDVVDALSSDSGVAAAAGLRTALRPDDVGGVSVKQGVATLELDTGFLDLPFGEQRVAVAQLVLTLTQQPGVGQTEFVTGGEPAQVPRGNGSMARAVSRDDYIEMLKVG